MNEDFTLKNIKKNVKNKGRKRRMREMYFNEFFFALEMRRDPYLYKKRWLKYERKKIHGLLKVDNRL